MGSIPIGVTTVLVLPVLILPVLVLPLLVLALLVLPLLTFHSPFCVGFLGILVSPVSAFYFLIALLFSLHSRSVNKRSFDERVPRLTLFCCRDSRRREIKIRRSWLLERRSPGQIRESLEWSSPSIPPDFYSIYQ